jgi:hypothetical protein
MTPPSGPPVRRRNLRIGHVFLLIVLLHNIIAIPLFTYELILGKASQPVNLFATGVVYALCWPFLLLLPLYLRFAARWPDPSLVLGCIGFLGLVLAWLSSSFFWAAMIALMVRFRRHRTLKHEDASSNHAMQPTAGHRTASLQIMKTHPFQFALAFASGG